MWFNRDMATTHPATGNLRLVNDRLVELHAGGKTTFVTCPWMIEIASGNPEPDSYEDTIKIVDCGAPVYAVGDDGWRCEAGHHHFTYGSADQQAEELSEALMCSMRQERGF